MARYAAIAATSTALAGLIRDRYPRAAFGPSLDVALYQASDFEKPMEEGFSLYLYRIAPNGSVRNLSYRRDPDGRRFRPSLPLDLAYLVTPWARDAEKQQRMLGWVMRFIEDVGVLSASQLNDYVSDPDVFRASEALDIICEPLSMQDYLTLWDRLHHRIPTSATYLMRMLMIESDVAIDEAGLVQTRRFGVGEPVA
ncbi:DUF4255 domain-containing protein [Solimonas soli]|uniref:DUF4255 domain-containing protein n=1 Tax=Solimonas soli TaxID=413479 RepID=UPI00047F7AFD|nr:DUF4255 domain-containing protein [Solimonas soli]